METFPKALTLLFPVALAFFVSPLVGIVAFLGALSLILLFAADIILATGFFFFFLLGSYFYFPFEDFLYIAGYLLLVILGWTFWSSWKTIREEKYQ